MPTDFALHDAPDDARGDVSSGGNRGADIAALFAQFEERSAAREAALKAEIFEAINSSNLSGSRGAARVSAGATFAGGGGGVGGGGGGDGGDGNFPAYIGGDEDDAASSSYLSANSTAPSGDTSTESEKLRRIVGEEDKTVAYDPIKRHLSVAWLKACAVKGGKHQPIQTCPLYPRRHRH